jgi:hypothetical protein
MRSPSVQRVLHAHHVASAFQTLQTLHTLGMVAVWHPRSVNAAYGAPTQPSVRHAFFFRDDTRRNCAYDIASLRENVPTALDSVPGDHLPAPLVRTVADTCIDTLIWKYYMKTRRIMQAYRDGLKFGTKEFTDRAYKQHRGVSSRKVS